MNWPAIFAIVRKDLLVLTRTKAVMIPLIVVPFIFTFLFPAIFASVPQLTYLAGVPLLDDGINEILRRFSPAFQQSLAHYTTDQRIVVLMVVYYFAPMYLLLPIMVASVVAADSLAGEKERKTMEALLYTPTSDRDLLAAKLLSAWMPALVIAWGGFILYSLIVNLVAWPTFGYIFFPTTIWWLLALWVAPAVAGMGLGFTVLVSARVNTFQEAYQLGGLVVLPIVGMIIGQGTGTLYLGPSFVFLLGLVVWLINVVLLWLGVRVLRRSSLIARL